MADRDSRVFPVVLRILYLLLAAAVTWVLVVGVNYYTTPLAERPHHPDFRTLRPAGTVGASWACTSNTRMAAGCTPRSRSRGWSR